ncbi:MAG: NAD(P)H-dependent oxidoreductase [Pseudomonadota bacterium]
MTILHIDASARTDGSVTRQLSQQTVDKIGGDVIRRDLANPLPQIDEAWLGANFTPAADRDAEAKDRLALSDTLVDELTRADTIVIGAPVYNFGVPAALKAWIDLIARAGLTFRYTENGPVGLLTGKRAIIVVASGGTPIGSDIDFTSGYLRHIMGFIGITDVEIIAADRVMAQQDKAIEEAEAAIAQLAA